MIELFSYQLAYSTLPLLLLMAFTIGMAKTGVHGISMFTIPVMALIFGGKVSSGLLLPMFLMADIFAVVYYHRHANWHYLKTLFPWAAIGVVLGTLIGNQINDQVFSGVMGAVVFVSVLLLIWMERTDHKHIPDASWFSILMGLLGGITSMVGNASFAVMALYLLSLRLPKTEYIATAAWFFLFVNFFKIPFHIFSWQTINLNSFLLNLTALPVILLGAYAGIILVRKTAEQHYRWFIIAVTLFSSILLIF